MIWVSLVPSALIFQSPSSREKTIYLPSREKAGSSSLLSEFLVRFFFPLPSAYITKMSQLGRQLA